MTQQTTEASCSNERYSSFIVEKNEGLSVSIQMVKSLIHSGKNNKYERLFSFVFSLVQ